MAHGRKKYMIGKIAETISLFLIAVSALSLAAAICFSILLRRFDSEYREAYKNEINTRAKVEKWDWSSPQWPIPGPIPVFENESGKHLKAQEELDNCTRQRPLGIALMVSQYILAFSLFSAVIFGGISTELKRF